MFPKLTDPRHVQRLFWPDVNFYDKEWEVIYSVKENDETFVPASNMMGKDYVSGFIAIGSILFPEAFLLHSQDRPPLSTEVRVVTTSVKDDHLRVLWGEIGRFVQSSEYPLDRKQGGPLIINHRDIRKLTSVKDQRECKISYLRGMVSERGEGMAGHHAAYTLIIGDEASGLSRMVYTQSDTWARRKLFIGNPNSGSEFFEEYCEAGDLLAPV